MPDDDRRITFRSPIAGVRATFESAPGESQDAEVFDLSRGGMFLETPHPLPVGKRILLEIHVTGEPAPWPALGRVMWSRQTHDGAERPYGMGIKLIDIEESISEAIDRLVIARVPTEVGLGTPFAPSRETTLQGVGTSSGPSTPRVIQVIDGSQTPPGGIAAEASLAIDLVARKADSRSPAPPTTEDTEIVREAANASPMLLSTDDLPATTRTGSPAFPQPSAAIAESPEFPRSVPPAAESSEFPRSVPPATESIGFPRSVPPAAGSPEMVESVGAIAGPQPIVRSFGTTAQDRADAHRDGDDDLRLPKRRSARWVVWMLVFIAAAAVGYGYRDRLLDTGSSSGSTKPPSP